MFAKVSMVRSDFKDILREEPQKKHEKQKPLMRFERAVCFMISSVTI